MEKRLPLGVEHSLLEAIPVELGDAFEEGPNEEQSFGTLVCMLAKDRCDRGDIQMGQLD